MYQKVNSENFNDNRNYGMTEFLRNLEIGETFIIPLSARGSAATCAIQAGMKLKTRKVDENNCIATRIK